MNSRSIIDDGIVIKDNIVERSDNLYVSPENPEEDVTSFYSDENFLLKLQDDINYLKNIEFKQQFNVRDIINGDIVLLNLSSPTN
jgi:translation initiation factor IF-1